MPIQQLENLINACADYTGGDPTDTLREATGKFLQHADQTLLAQAAEYLPEINLSGVSWLAVTLGSAVESGADATVTGPPLVAILESWLAQLPTPVQSDPDDPDSDEEFPEPSPDQQIILNAFPMFCQALVAHLARMPGHKKTLSGNDVLLDRLKDAEVYSYAACWVREALLRTSGPLVVIHPPSQRGFLLQISNVANCFHLFTLIQGAIGQRLPGGKEPNDEVMAIARGGKRRDSR